MNFHTFVFVSLLTCSNVLSTKKQGHIFREDFWQTLAPGELLNELDLMTSGELRNSKLFKTFTEAKKENTTIVPLFKKRIKTKEPKRRNEKIKSTPVKSIRRLSKTEDGSAASASASVEQDDYDRTYEQFVNRYFNDAAERYLSENDDGDDLTDVSASRDASYLSGSIETAISGPLDVQLKSTKKTNKKCRKVHKNGEICFICKNPRTDEHSETCSYEHSSEPETYAYESQRKFRKSRDSEDDKNVSDDDGDENVSAETDSFESVAESKSFAQIASPLAALNDTHLKDFPSNNSCIKRTTSGKACYYCRNQLGKLQVNCFSLKPLEITENLKSKPINENSHKKRRIFKRTLSYVFEKGLDSNGTLNLPKQLTQNSTEYMH